MSRSRSLLLAGAACAPFIAVAAEAQAQSALSLPEVVVTAPSPIQRPSATPPDAAALQGTLPIVTDQFATVTAVPESEIRRTPGASIGEILSQKPGITSSGFAPGSNRPIVRGLDNYRVRVQENGLATNDVSEMGEDHGVAIDPLGARQIEVIRGPATLRYGSQAIGGVINAENNRIPTAIPYLGYSAEMNGAFTSVDRGREGSLLLDAGKGNVAVHADMFGRNAGDYAIPGYPYLAPEGVPAPTVGSHQPNSAQRTSGQSVGGSYLFNGGFIGLAVTNFESFYRMPGEEPTDTNSRIDLHQTKVTSKGEFRPDSSVIDAIRYWAGASNYKHDELANEGGFDGIQQTFTNKAEELRVETQLLPFDLRFAQLTTAIGAQFGEQRLTAGGAEGGLYDPNRTRTAAAYLFNEFRFDPLTRAQISGRIETVNITGSSPDFPSELPIARDRSFTPASVAFGLLRDLPGGMVASVTAQRVERAPRAPELFSRGVHEATGTFDIGDANLGVEVAQSVEAGLRKAQGPLRFEATVYYTRFNGFIFRNLTGAMCDDDFASCGTTGSEFNQANYSQRDAIFRGAELQAQYDVSPLWRGLWGIDGQYDIVRATFTDGTNVPRIPPQRLGGGVYYRDTNWFARVGLLHAFEQNDFGASGSPTPGYDLLRAELAYTTKLRPGDFGPREITFGITGTNLLDDEVRLATAFNKDEVLQPGRNVKLFTTVKY